MKALVAESLAKRVKDGDVLGIGSGSTVELAVQAIGKRIKTEKLKIYGMPTSFRIAQVAEEAGLVVLSPLSYPRLDWGFDGADEVDPLHNLIKGRGAAMFAEKVMARAISGKLVIIVSEDKLVSRLGQSFAVPVEVLPLAVDLVTKELCRLGVADLSLRQATEKYGPVVTEQGNFVLDARFNKIEPALEGEIKSITGVVESGLFFGFRPELLIASKTGVVQRKIVDGVSIDCGTT